MNIDEERSTIEQLLKKWKKLQEGAWIKHKKPSKISGTLGFNKADQDSIGNKSNYNIVPFKGINNKWGIS